MTEKSSSLCFLGDVHGHLQLGLCLAAAWQVEREKRFDAVFLCGDVGTFTEEAQLDNATRAHARSNPCELEFLTQWAVSPPAPWLEAIFAPEEVSGLGLTCPVVMVHGNHEGFPHLERILSALDDLYPQAPVPVEELPTVDAGGFLRYLPSGWRCRTAGGMIVGGVGGIERGQRAAKYHELAYLDEGAIEHLIAAGPLDVLVSHQGPQQVQGDKGSRTLDRLLDAQLAPVWFHGHSTPRPEIVQVGPRECTLVAPLRDLAFPGKGPDDLPGADGWCWLEKGQAPVRGRPSQYRDFKRSRWIETPDGRLVAPPLRNHFPDGRPGGRKSGRN